MNDNLIQIANILAKYDPEGLIKLGAPADEYKPEAEGILNWLFSPSRPELTIPELEFAIQDIFKQMFGCQSYPPNHFLPIAKEIFEKVVSNG